MPKSRKIMKIHKIRKMEIPPELAKLSPIELGEACDEIKVRKLEIIQEILIAR